MGKGNGSLEYNSQPLMEGWGQIPSQPSKFVSILHLRERWLKENEHKQLQPTQHERIKDDQKPRIHTCSSWSSNHRSRKFLGYYQAVPVSSLPCKKSVHQAEPVLAESDEKIKNLHQKKPRSQSESVGELLPAVSSIESESQEKKEKSMEKHLMKNKPRSSQNEQVGEALLAVSLIQSDEKKNNTSMKKHLMAKKPRSQSEDLGDPLLPVSTIERNEKKNKSMKKHLLEDKPRSRTQDEGEALLAVSPIKSDQKKKKSKRNRCLKKPVSQSREIDITPPTPEENLNKGMRGKECEPNEKKYIIARKIDVKKGIESQCGSGTGITNAMKEIENKLIRISVSFENKRGRNNGVYKGCSHGNRNFRDHRDLHRLAARNQRDAGMIWVRKDELPQGA